jgi:hypothetical protein
MALWMVQHGHQPGRQAGSAASGEATGLDALRLLAAHATREEG